MDDKLKIYELLYQAYADEIKNLWQRSVFLATFMVLVWTGYGALQLKFIEKSADISTLSSTYHLVSAGLCGVIVVLSLLWIAMAKGSKFVQEAHEWHINAFKFSELKRNTKSLFCDLDKYEYLNVTNLLNTKNKYINSKLSANLFLCGTTRAYRYSPSKINIALGWLSFVVATTLCMIHIIIYSNFCYILIILVICVVALIFCITLFIKQCLKGGEQYKTKTIKQFFTNLWKCIVNKINSNKGAKNG